MCGAGKAGQTAPGAEHSNRGLETPFLTDWLRDLTEGASPSGAPFSSTHKSLWEDEMEHANALTTRKWADPIESKCARGKAFPITSAQPEPREKSLPQEKTGPLQKPPELRSRVFRHSRDVRRAVDFSLSQRLEGAGTGQRRPTL